jgi:hypothetical protein
MKKIKYQSKTVEIAVAVYAAKKLEIGEIIPDGSYDRITGIAVHRINDAGAANANYKVGLQNDSGVVHDLTHIGNWATGKDDGTNPNERFKEINIDIKGSGNLQCMVELPAQNLATKLEVEFVIRLEQDLVRVGQ